jgi:hypothetical protein
MKLLIGQNRVNFGLVICEPAANAADVRGYKKKLRKVSGLPILPIF